MVKFANRPAKPQPQADMGFFFVFDDELWKLIEECWSQKPSNRPTAATVSLRLGENCCHAKRAEMYTELADLTAELASVKERSKAARQEFETELARLRDSLARRECEQAELKKDWDKERDLLARLEREKAELKKNLDEERDLRKRLEKNADDLLQPESLSNEGHLTGHQDDVVIA